MIPASAPSHQRVAAQPAARRGTAEIELLIVIPVLLAILFIMGAMLKLGPARIFNVFHANEEAYRDATAVDDPQYASDGTLEPIPDPMLNIRPELPALPNRLHVAEADQPVTMTLGRIAVPQVNLVNRAAYPSPTWSYSSWPVSGDSDILQSWVQAYIDESTGNVREPLELAPAWPL